MAGGKPDLPPVTFPVDVLAATAAAAVVEYPH